MSRDVCILISPNTKYPVLYHCTEHNVRPEVTCVPCQFRAWAFFPVVPGGPFPAV